MSERRTCASKAHHPIGEAHLIPGFFIFLASLAVQIIFQVNSAAAPGPVTAFAVMASCGLTIFGLFVYLYIKVMQECAELMGR
jgi:hypothetical protein